MPTPLRQQPLSERIVAEYRKRETGHLGRLARKFSVPRGEVKRLIDTMLFIASADGDRRVPNARASIAAFNRRWRER